MTVDDERRAMDISVADLARRTGMHYQYVYRHLMTDDFDSAERAAIESVISRRRLELIQLALA